MPISHVEIPKIFSPGPDERALVFCNGEIGRPTPGNLRESEGRAVGRARRGSGSPYGTRVPAAARVNAGVRRRTPSVSPPVLPLRPPILIKATCVRSEYLWMKGVLIIIALALPLAGCGDRASALQAAAPGGDPGSAQPGEGTPSNKAPSTAARVDRSQVSPDEPAAPAYDLQLGEAVFTNTCLACHGKGVYHAPVLGNAADWEPRLKQDLDTLIQHAINGHRGMPPKGGFFLLSDEEVAAAVAYAVDKSKKIVMAMKRKKRSEGCNPVKNLDKCSKPELEEVLTLQMLLLLGGGGK